jgi:putative ABC transport system permease protein
VLAKYAWMSFIRRRLRASLAIMGIALSVGLLVAVLAISSSVEKAISDSLGAAGADMVIQRRVKPCPFAEIKLPKDLAEIKGEVVRQIAALEQVDSVSGVLLLWAFYKGHPTVVAGIDPTKRTIGPVRLSSREPGQEAPAGGAAEESDESCCAITKGRYLVRYDDRHALLTEAYAKATGADVGDKIPLGPRDKFEVVGLVDMSGAARIAEAEAFIPLKTAQEMYGQGDIVDTIFVALKSTRSIPLVSRVVQEWIGPETSITTSQNVDAATSAVATVTRKSFLAVSGLVLLFVLLLITRNALASVAERLAEVGVMRAIGWRRSEVSRLFMFEEFFAGLGGGILGCLGGWLLAYAYSQLADLKLPSALSSFPPCSTTEPPLALPLSTVPSPLVFAIGLAAALLLSAVAGFAASRRASSLDPAEALRRL